MTVELTPLECERLRYAAGHLGSEDDADSGYAEASAELAWDTFAEVISDRVSNTIDAAHLERQRAWSEATFGPGSRLNGVLDHIRKELDEIAADPTDLSEWCDVIILAFDGALRAGHPPQAIIHAIKAKQAKNEAREWPDWRTMDADQAIEHVR